MQKLVSLGVGSYEGKRYKVANLPLIEKENGAIIHTNVGCNGHNWSHAFDGRSSVSRSSTGK